MDNGMNLPNLLAPTPNKTVEQSKVPSVYNNLMAKLAGAQNVLPIPKVEIFDLTSTEKSAYESLMLKISEHPDKYHFIQSNDHWTKDGDLIRAIDYVELKKMEKQSKEVKTTDKALDEEIKQDLKDKLADKHKEVQEELTKDLDEEALKEKAKKEAEEDAQKIEDAITEAEIEMEEVEPEKGETDEGTELLPEE